ncbi:MAG: ATP-binding protein, partial [Odoribacter sp.]|nr:ATP-binding protein [Odoribacter sp.]
ILEAIAMVSAQEEIGRVNIESLIGKGVRVAKPTLTVSSFRGKALSSSINIQVKLTEKGEEFFYNYAFCCKDADDIYSEWEEQSKVDFFSHLNDIQQRREWKAGERASDVFDEIDKALAIKRMLGDYLVYSPNISALRGFSNRSIKTPLGINGEGLDLMIASFVSEQKQKLLFDCHVDWLDNILIDNKEEYKRLGYKLGRSISNLFFVDKYMQKKNNVFSAENANEGALFILFYLALFISDKTPSFFAIDNIESGLNPRLCRYLMKTLAELSKKSNKQSLITTHNPAILDGLNLHDDEQRLFVVSRNDEGQTKVERIKLKPEGQENVKLSDLWISGQLGGIPKMF